MSRTRTSRATQVRRVYHDHLKIAYHAWRSHIAVTLYGNRYVTRLAIKDGAPLPNSFLKTVRTWREREGALSMRLPSCTVHLAGRTAEINTHTFFGGRSKSTEVPLAALKFKCARARARIIEARVRNAGSALRVCALAHRGLLRLPAHPFRSGLLAS